MVRGKQKTISNRNQYTLASSEPTFSEHSKPWVSNIPENQDADQKSHLIKIIESFKEDIYNSLKEIQESTGKQVKELNKSIQDLKVELETIKKTQWRQG